MTDYAPATTSRLSERQREVLALIAAGHTNPQITDILGISLQTTKTHIRLACAKLDASNRSHAALLALQSGEI